ncbi:Ig-like domain-containing protein [uncultured Imperialibacter sp.]|uniref:Ig-like domain-containing protein n=1 Tax=uncultured Imperialibacter sp. TaxID=1672639 RepID=UPI0030D918E2|tara:strand:+ start:41 stop:1000 length:960 start_codon:yes stop_codon:yes gene_type:complete
MKSASTISFLHFFIACVFVVGCGGETDEPDPVEEVHPTLLLSERDINILMEDSTLLRYTILPDTITIDDLKWTSSDEEVATVSATGLLRALSIGTATIKLSSESEEVEATLTVNVLPIPLSSVEIAGGDSVVVAFVNTEESLDLAFLPENATDKSIQWRSSNTNVLSVDPTGKALAKTLGYVFVEAYRENDPRIYDAVTVIPAEEGQLVAASFVNVVTFAGKYQYKVFLGSIDVPVTTGKVTLYSTNGFTFTIEAEIAATTEAIDIAANHAAQIATLEVTEAEFNDLSLGALVSVEISLNGVDYDVMVNGNSVIRVVEK